MAVLDSPNTFAMSEKTPKYTPEQIAELEKSRTISDAELLKDGAEYNRDHALEPTGEQIKEILSTHKKEISDTLVKAYTDITLAYNGNDERVLSNKELLEGGPARVKDEDGWFWETDKDHANFIFDKMSEQVILEISEQQRLELSGRGEDVEDSIDRIKGIVKGLVLKEGDRIRLKLRDSTTCDGYYQFASTTEPNKIFWWSGDHKKAYFPLGGWINEGQFSFAIRGGTEIPVQAIEDISVLDRRN